MTLRIIGYILACFTLVTCAGLISLDSIDRIISDQNIIQTETGAVRLGKVYKEKLITEYVISKSDNGEVFLKATESTPRIYDSVLTQFKKIVDDINRDGGIEGKDGKKSMLNYSEATYKDDVTIKIKTYVQYQAERAESFSLTINESSETLKAGSSTLQAIKTLISYQSAMEKDFYNMKRFIAEK